MKFLQKLKDFIFTNRGAALLLILLGIVIYARSLPNEMFWDDDDFILKNRYVKDWLMVDLLHVVSAEPANGEPSRRPKRRRGG